MEQVTEQPDAPAPVDGADDFAGLEREAAALEGAIQAANEPPPPAPTNNAQELRGALLMARMMVAPMFKWWPEFADTWSDQTIEGIAQGGGAVMDKHGWTFGGLMEEFGPYIALGVAVVPPSMVTWQAIKAQKAQANKPRGQGDARGG